MASIKAPALMLVLTALFLSASAASAAYSEILEEAKDMQDWLVSTRRDLHRNAELGFNMYNTSTKLRVFLEKEGISYKFPFAFAGLVATIGSGGAPYVMLRTGTDAVPLLEPEECLFRSQADGVMHAGAADASMAMLMGAARLLKKREAELVGTVLLMFQPGSEGKGGALRMIKEGAVKQAEAIFGVRIVSDLPSGTVATHPGTVMAGSYSFTFTINGEGGVHETSSGSNPASAAAAIITEMTALTANDNGRAIISITRLNARSTHHIVPDNSSFGGTLRGLAPEHLGALKMAMEETAQHAAARFGCTSQVDWHEQTHPYEPPTVNDRRLAATSHRAATKLFGAAQVQALAPPPPVHDAAESSGGGACMAPKIRKEGEPKEAAPLMMQDDFGSFCQSAPCSLLFLGNHNPKAGAVHDLYRPSFVLDEGLLHKGAALNAALAMEYLQSRRAPPPAGLPHEAAAASHDDL